MKLRNKIATGFLVFLVIAMSSLALVLSHNSACQPGPISAADTSQTDAIVYRCYGSPEVLTLEPVEKPAPEANEVLVKVHAASVNPTDWHHMRGSPYLLRLASSGLGAPQDTRLGTDFAGTVEAVGAAVTRFAPGDEVFGGGRGAFAHYLTIREDRALALKPPGVSFEQAASVPVAGLTALQALRDKGKIGKSTRVLINGASGGVGTFAVQIAKSYGAHVTGVCSTRNQEMVQSIGADRVIDYKQQNYTELDERYDLIIDMVGNHSLLANRRVLEPDGAMVIVGGPSGNWLGPLMGPIKAMLLSPFIDQDISLLLASLNSNDLNTLATLMQAGELTPVIGNRYTLAQVPEAITHSEQGHARGKIAITVNQATRSN